MSNTFFRPGSSPMGHLLLCLVLFCTARPVSAQAPLVRELAPGVFYYFGDEKQQKSANCTWVVFNDYVLAIDANYPWAATEILEEIRKTSMKPVRFLFNTHYHHDHSFGNAQFADAGATILSTTKAAEEMHTLGQYEWEHGYSPRKMDGYRREYPSVTFEDRLVFDDGTHRVELINMGPAHSGGDGIAYLPKERILITGDLFVNGNPWGNNVADPDVNYDRWIEVLEKLAGWNPRIVIPGHGMPATSENLREQRLYLKDMLEQVRAGIKAGKPKSRLQQEVDLGKHPVFGANKISTVRSVGAMFDKLSSKSRK